MPLFELREETAEDNTLFYVLQFTWLEQQIKYEPSDWDKQNGEHNYSLKPLTIEAMRINVLEQLKKYHLKVSPQHSDPCYQRAFIFTPKYQQGNEKMLDILFLHENADKTKRLLKRDITGIC